MPIFQFFSELLNLVFPARCIGCNKTDSYLCNECLSKIPKSTSREHEFIESLFEYKNNVIEKAIWKLKYSGIKDSANLFGQLIYERILEKIAEERVFKDIREIILIPIPTSEKRIRARGFNQANLIAKGIICCDKENLFHLSNNLIKHRDTESQMKIKNRNERIQNVKDSFSVKNKSEIIGKYIILIDDITTTGATLSEARKVLIEAGAKSVSAYTIAH